MVEEDSGGKSVHGAVKQKLGKAPVVRSQPSMLKRAKPTAGVVRSAASVLFELTGNTGALCHRLFSRHCLPRVAIRCQRYSTDAASAVASYGRSRTLAALCCCQVSPGARDIPPASADENFCKATV